VSAAALVLLAWLGPAQEPDPPTFAALVETVFVDVVVTRDGKPVLGLDASHFEVKDNGVRQRPRIVALDEFPIGATLVFDSSSSVAGSRLRDLRKAGHAVVEAVDPDAVLALMVFNHQAQLLVPPSHDRVKVGAALDGIEAGGRTALFDAIYMALMLDTPVRRPAIVVFTDGDDTSSWLTVEELRTAVSRSDAILHVVGLRLSGGQGSQAARTFGTFNSNPGAAAESSLARNLRQITELTGGRLWEARESERLAETFLQILAEMKTRYVLAYEPGGVERLGEHRLEVRLKRAKGEVRARQGYFVGPASR